MISRGSTLVCPLIYKLLHDQVASFNPSILFTCGKREFIINSLPIKAL